MRIIAGIYKGRKLYSPKGNEVRPTGDRVREAIFSMLIPYMKKGFVAMDVFSGSGSLGLEAVSRGAARVFFSDSSRENLNLTKRNLKLCGAEENAVLLLGDFRANIKRVREPVDIFFLDPPYAEDFIPDALRSIEEAGNLAPGGVVVCEHSGKRKLPEETGGFTAVKDRRYGAAGVTVYAKTKNEEF